MNDASREPRTKAQLLEEIERLRARLDEVGKTTSTPSSPGDGSPLGRLNRTLRALSNINQALMRAADEAELLQAACQIIVEDCGHALAWIGYAEPDEARSVRPVASAGFEEGYLETLKLTWADTERGRGPTGTAIRTGKPSLCRNMFTDPRFEPWREEALKRGYASSIVLPLLADGGTLGAVSVYSREPDPFSEDEVALLAELAGDLAYGVATLRARDAHRRAEEALERSEERYRALFDSMTEGFALHEIVYDEKGSSRDYRFLDVNPAFERLTGLRREDVVGRLHGEVLPNDSPYWLEAYAGVARTGEPARFEHYSPELRRHFEVFAYRTAPHQFAVVFIDVSERAHAERILAARSGVTELLAAADSLEEIAPRLLRHLGETLGWLGGELWLADPGSERLRRVGYWQAAGAGLDELDAAGAPLSFARGEGLPGRIWMSGRPVWFANPEEIPEFPRSDLAQQLGVKSILGFPVLLGEDVLGALVFATTEPRTPDSALLETASLVGGQVGQFIARKRAEEAVRESQLRLAAIVGSIADGFYAVDRDLRFTFVNDAALGHFGKAREDLIGRSLLEVFPGIAGSRFESEVRHALESHTSGHFEIKSLLKEGTIEFRLYPGHEGLSVLFRDVTERERAAEALRQAHERAAWLARFPDENPRPVARVTAEGRVLYCNSIGAREDEWACRVGELLPPMLLELVLHAMEGGRPVQGDVEIAARTYSVTVAPFPAESYANLYGLDITERKRAEEVLRESEERYRSLFSALIEGYCVIEMIFDGDGRPVDYRFLEINPAFEAQTGLHDAQGKRIRELVPDLETQWIEKYGAVAVTGEAEHFVNEVRALSRWFEVYAFRVGGPDSRKVAVCFNDITRRRQAEEAIEAARVSLQRERDILQSVMNGARNSHLVYLDLEFNFVRVNETYARTCGFTPEQMVGKNHFALYPDEENEAIFTRVRDRGLPAEYHDKSFVFPDQPERGTTYWDWTLVPIHDDSGHVGGLVFSLVETTGRVRAEQALRDSEERYRVLVELAPDAVLVYQGGRCVYANSAGLRLFGAREESQLLGRRMLDLIHPDDRARVDEHLGAAEDGAPTVADEIRVARLDGDTVLAEASATPVVFRGRPAVQVIARDISERRRLEERLAQAQKMEALGVLAGGVAHDFNNLLVGVIGNASLAQDMLPLANPVQPFLERIVKAGEHAAALTRQLLAYAGKGRLALEQVDVSALVRDGAELLRSSIPNKITVRLELADGLPPIYGDRGQIQQVFMNLALNASEAIGPGGGQITVRTGQRELPAATPGGSRTDMRSGTAVVLEVSDTGSGMDEDTCARIFDPFFTTKFLGRGLGLAAVSGIVRGHGGTIQVASAPGKGSCFTVLIPTAEGEVAPAAAPVPGESAAPAAGTVLLVDDEEIVLDMARIALQRHGLEVLLADSGPAAIELFRRESARVQLVILDLSMPGMGGGEVFQELVRIRPDVRVVISSGYSEDEVRKVIPDAPGLGFIQKPYTMARFVEDVKRALG